jgi:TolA-binding protein
MTFTRALLPLALLLTGCLKTRGDLRSESTDTTPQVQTAAAQRAQAAESGPTVTLMAAPGKPAASAAKVEDMDEQMRNLTGRMEVVENNLNQTTAAADAAHNEYIKDKLTLEQRVMVYEEEFKKLQADIAGLTEQVTALKTAAAAAPSTAPMVTMMPAPAPKDPLELATEMFAAKKWKEAAAAFQKYREAFPKGKSYADATYKIGVCFQELGLKDEAKSFYDEVIAKFPKAKEAKKASIRNKSLK